MASSLSIIRCVLGTPTRALGCLGRRTTAMHNPKASLAVTAVIKILPAPALLFVANIKELLHEPEIAEDVDQFLSTLDLQPVPLLVVDALNRRGLVDAFPAASLCSFTTITCFDSSPCTGWGGILQHISLVCPCWSMS